MGPSYHQCPVGAQAACEKQPGGCPLSPGLPHCSAFLSTNGEWQTKLQRVTWLFLPALPSASLEVSGTRFLAQSLFPPE